MEVIDEYLSNENVGVKVDGLLLKDYLLLTGQVLRGIFQKETFLVTRMFDQRAKSFIKECNNGSR